MHYLQDRIWHLYQQIKTGPKSKFGPIFFTKKDDIHRFADRYGRKISMPMLRNTRTTNTYQVEFRRFKKSVEKFQKVLKKRNILVLRLFSRNVSTEHKKSMVWGYSITLNTRRISQIE